MCDVSLLPIPPSIPSTLAALIPFNNIDKDPQNVSQLRESHYFSLNTVTAIQSIKSLCPENQSIKPKYPLSDINDLTPTVAEPKTLSPPNISLFTETVPIRADSARHGTVPNFVRSSTHQYDTVLYSTVPDANHLELIYPSMVQSKNSLNSTSVPLTVPLTFVQGLKTPKRKNTHFKNKYLQKKNFPRTPLLVPRIIELSKDADPHLDHGLILDPLTLVTMGLVVPELDALGQPLSEGFYPGVSSNPSTMGDIYIEKKYNCKLVR